MTCRRGRATQSTSPGEQGWYLDSGATDYITYDRSQFSSYEEISNISIRTGDDHIFDAQGIRDVTLLATVSDGEVEIALHNVLHIPDFRTSLVSIIQIEERKCYALFGEGECKIYSPQGEIVAVGNRRTCSLHRLQAVHINEKVAPTTSRAAFNTTRDTNMSELWHQRYGHLNGKSLQALQLNNMVTGMSAASDMQAANCVGCLQGKQHRKAFPSLPADHKRQEKLALVHTDLCGPMNVASIGGRRYLLTFIDDFSRRIWTCFLRLKSEVLYCFQLFVSEAERQTGMKVKAVRSDRGGEYTLNAFKRFCSDHGIRQELTQGYTPQQNGVAERANRTLVEMARAMLYHVVGRKESVPSPMSCPKLMLRDRLVLGS